MSSYYGRVNASYKRQNITALAKALEKKSIEVSEEAIRETAEVAKMEAEMLYRDAIYDGPEPRIVVDAYKTKAGNYQVKATGEAVLFIEYGTGEARDGGYRNAKSGGPYWFFTYPADATATTEHAHRKVKRYDENADPMFYMKSKKGPDEMGHKGRFFTEQQFERMLDRSGVTAFGARERAKEKYSATEYIEKEGSAFTRGTPPQHIMREAIKKARRFLKEKYKTK